MSARPGALGAWIRASRLASQPTIALPLLLGQVLGARAAGRPLDLGTLAAVHLFGLLDQLFIVYANDVADQETDRRNRTATPFSGGSRVLVEGRLSPRALGAAAAGCAAALVAVSAWLAVTVSTPAAPLLVPLAIAALLLLWAYSYPPLRLSYRGGGELLQMVGVGAVLPLYGYVAQGGALDRFPVALLACLLPGHLACAIATALPDEPSDRESGKRTLPVRLGGERAARRVALLNALSLLLAPVGLGAAGLRPGAGLLIPAAAALVVLLARPAPPGSRLLLVRVGAAGAATLSLVAVTAWLANAAR
ncbi:prenyltransferase [Sorangium sp. So ce406]|uniref:prenyltransferase n=1 Tax=Sorangium sp. So ce406 TaxID=3133311 RepID=UPI003F5C3471